MKLKRRRPSKNPDVLVPQTFPSLTNEKLTSAATKLKNKKTKQIPLQSDFLPFDGFISCVPRTCVEERCYLLSVKRLDDVIASFA